MMRQLLCVLVPLLTLVHLGCTPLPSHDEQQVAITVAEPDRTRFSGKGAGAGMMLMSAMGPMGIAIGVAIDEGIAKDIHQVSTAAGVDIQALLKRSLQTRRPEFSSVYQVNIQRYGFVTQRGENDPVTAELHLELLMDSGTKVVKYPEDVQPESIQTAPLEEVKADAEVVKSLYEHALSSLLE